MRARFVMVPALQCNTDLTMKSVVATSLDVIALVSATGVVSSAVSGQVSRAVALPFSGGALVGMTNAGAKHFLNPVCNRDLVALVAVGMMVEVMQ